MEHNACLRVVSIGSTVSTKHAVRVRSLDWTDNARKRHPNFLCLLARILKPKWPNEPKMRFSIPQAYLTALVLAGNGASSAGFRTAHAFQVSHTNPLLSRCSHVGWSATNQGKVRSKFSLTNLFAVKQEVDPGAVEGTDLRIVKYPNPSLRAPNEEITEE